jgi:N-acyl-phosphatidylethanolamine-hydrolysing phospholipase D
VPLATLPPIDFVVISHNHYDHLDLPTLRALAKRRAETVFLVPLGNGALLRRAGIERVEELDWGDTRTIGAVTVHCLPNQHWSSRGLTDERKALWSSWSVIGAERRVYFAGDTGLFPELESIGGALGPFDLALLPIGAYEPVPMMRPVHLDPEEAVEAARMLRAERAVAMHFGTFDLTDEPIGEPPVRFREAAAAAGRDADAAWVLRIGETRDF